jgi:hypothetical protein
MKPSQVEHRVLGVLDAVTRKDAPVEDSLVELKSRWPVAEQKTARQIAGHLNAARGEPVLWIVGVDDDAKTVVGARPEELANWWPAIEKHFDGLAPTLLHVLNVPFGETAVVGLLFDSSRGPFVVKCPNSGGPDREVPWREGNRTRSARREDLLRLLVPQVSKARFDILQGTLHLFEQPRQTEAIWRLQLRFYVTPGDDRRLFIPAHHCSTTVRTTDGQVVIPLSADVALLPAADRGMIELGAAELIVSGPGPVDLVAEGKTVQNLLGHSLDLEFLVSMQPTMGDAVMLIGKLEPSRLPPNEAGPIAVWAMNGHRRTS